MGNFKTYALAGILALAASATARAADLPAGLPPMPPAPAPIEVGGGWYLRGDIGMTNQDADKLGVGDASDADFRTIHLDFDSSPLFGLGVGYQFNNWIRADVTGEYRGKSTLHALELSRVDPGFTNQFTGTKSEWVGLANVYFDLGTWYGITPFVGAGVGFAHVTMDNFVDTAISTAGLAFAGEESKTNFAWALHAGLTYDVTDHFKVELAYRYLNMGDGETGTLVRRDFSGCNCRSMKFEEIDSHDVKVGVRWMLGPIAAAAPPGPVIRKY
jgi:opacity protein-like surface antigen